MKYDKLEIRTNMSGKVHLKSDYTHPKGNSETVQGDSYTIAELLKRSLSGNVPPIQRMGQYHDKPTHDTDVRIEDPNFDLSDAALIKAEIEEKQANAREAQKTKQSADLQRKAEEKAEQALGSKATMTKEEEASDLALNSAGEVEKPQNQKQKLLHITENLNPF